MGPAGRAVPECQGYRAEAGAPGQGGRDEPPESLREKHARGFCDAPEPFRDGAPVELKE